MAVGALLVFGLLVHISCGATYALVPFVKPNAVGSVAGIVGAGGNLGAVLSGFLFGIQSLSLPGTFLLLGVGVVLASSASVLLRFPVTRVAAAGAIAEDSEVVTDALPAVV
jgi:NNP family nitrate/nitrite transporter-like MFS transporter